jgi:predicted nucleic acid-binding protein
MPNNRYYWDSSVFLSLLNGLPDRVPTIRGIMMEVEKDRNSFILTSSESIVEVAHIAEEKINLRLDPHVEALIDELWAMDQVIRIIDNGSHIAPIARRLIRDAIPHGWVLRPKDAVHLASALWYNQHVHRLQEVHTYDDALFKYGVMIGIHICEPYVQQPGLM